MRKKKESGKSEEDTTIAEFEEILKKRAEKEKLINQLDSEFREEERQKTKRSEYKIYNKTSVEREEGKKENEEQKENDKKTSLKIDIVVQYLKGKNRRKKWRVTIPTRDKIKFDKNYKKYGDKDFNNIERIQDNEWKKRLEYQIPVLEMIRRENNDASKKAEQELGKVSETGKKYEKEYRYDE